MLFLTQIVSYTGAKNAKRHHRGKHEEARDSQAATSASPYGVSSAQLYVYLVLVFMYVRNGRVCGVCICIKHMNRWGCVSDVHFT